MNSFYSRTGDDGYTGVLGEGRIPKYHPVTEAIGAIDEASAALGMARAHCHEAASGELLITVQRDLYALMAEVAATPENAPRFRKIDAERLAWLEAAADRVSASVELPKDFIVPGDSIGGASLALARTIVRRAERRVSRLYVDGSLENAYLLRYLNRLSSLCFVLELAENRAVGNAAPTLAKKG